jgi:hypothetical protein
MKLAIIGTRDPNPNLSWRHHEVNKQGSFSEEKLK